MARMSKEEYLKEVHQLARKRFDEIITLSKDQRTQCLQDRRFQAIAGAQWEGKLGEQFANKPQIEINKIRKEVNRVFGEYANSRKTVDFISDEEKDVEKADLCDALYRADEKFSNAPGAYDNAFREGSSGGIGAWRLRAVLEDEYDPDNDMMRIKIEPIFDADSVVFFDPNDKTEDKSESKYCFLINAITRDAYIEQYSEDPATWPSPIQEYVFDWYDSKANIVYVAEYYVEEEKSTYTVTYKNIDDSETKYAAIDFENDPELADRLNAIGSTEIKRKKIKKKRIHKYILSGNSVLEDCEYIAGPNIPIAPYYGQREVIDNIEICQGIVRVAKDSQRLYNMQISKLAEIVGLSSVEKPIFFPEQIINHQHSWVNDNLLNLPFLTIDPITNGIEGTQYLPPIAYTKAPSVPPAMAALIQINQPDIQDVLGNPQGGDKIVSNISEEAIGKVQARLDMQSYIYVDNFKKAMKRSGEIWLGMAREVYTDENRKINAIDPEGKTRTVTLMKPAISENGEMYFENDLSNAFFEVGVDVGPSSASRREAVVRGLTGMMSVTQDPETLQILSLMCLMNMEGEGLSDVRSYARQKLIHLGVVKPNAAEQKELIAEMEARNNQSDPNAILMQAIAEEASAKAAKARADTVQTIADAELKKAQTQNTFADADLKQAKTMEIMFGANV